MAVIKSERKHFPDQVFLKRRNRPFGGFAAAVNLLHTPYPPRFAAQNENPSPIMPANDVTNFRTQRI